TIYSTCLKYGIDITKERIPVAPAEHYCMGGIRTDVNGRTNIEGFYACGEAACNGIHGANRLASNSLLEGLVFGKRIALEANRRVLNKQGRKAKALPVIKHECLFTEPMKDAGALKLSLRKLMTENVGIIRNEEKLREALQHIAEIKDWIQGKAYTDIEHWELVNMLTLSELVVKSALMRKESRGAHYRTDYPQTDDINWKKNTVI
ncbi:MAG: FAD-binding protein, partial [Clostridiaceae bacterium]|nr:FAD-binding protein [Clostridiaceae bacterium]